jgi:hypothetical protein
MMKMIFALVFPIFMLFTTVFASDPASGIDLNFSRIKISPNTFEAASIFDVNNDGVLDIVSGGYWFPGPDFAKQIKICDVPREDEEYYDDFADYPLDVNGDGYLDIVTGGYWGQTLRWRENPKGQPVPWTVHDIGRCGNIETIRFWDVDGDGFSEIVPNLINGPYYVYKLIRDAQGRGTAKFERYEIFSEPGGQGHGLGFGDVDGDGKPDFILPNGWLKNPGGDPLTKKWQLQPEFHLGMSSVPILVYDVDADGLPDLIVGQAHDYGLDWWRQKRDESGKRTWTKHSIDATVSQYHDLQLHDLDNDGWPELVTGKRCRAHRDNDPGAADPVGLFYFRINKGRFQKFTIDYGPPAQTAGVGIYFWVADIDGNGYKDILAPGKTGLVLFKNLGPKIPPSKP